MIVKKYEDKELKRLFYTKDRIFLKRSKFFDQIHYYQSAKEAIYLTHALKCVFLAQNCFPDVYF